MLLKFSERRWLERLRDGYVLFRPQVYFAKLESDPVRGDCFETVDEVAQPKKIKSLRIHNHETGKVLELRPSGPLKINFGKRAYNVFSMYSIPTSTVGCPEVDPQNLAFGDSFIAILDSQEFFNRVLPAAEKTGFNVDCHLVEYFDPDTYSGEVGPFRKPKNFEYQRELRIIITPGTVEPVELRVGNLHDITTPIFPLAEINLLLELNPSQG